MAGLPAGCYRTIFVGVTGVLWNGPIACAAAFVINLFLIRRIFRDLEREMG